MADINDLKNRTVSHGTLNPDHLIPVFCDVLKEYAPDKYAEFIKGYPELDGWEEFLEADWRLVSDDTKMNASDELFGLLNDIAPEGTMFSSTEGDGADFGFWSVEEKLLDDDEGEQALKQMAKAGKSTGEVAADIRYDVATALDMAADKAEDMMTKFGLDKIYVLRAKGLSPKAIAKKILKACESKDEGWLGGFYSRQDVLDAMDGGILNKDWKLEKRFGNWGCYVNQDTGRPLVLQVMVSQDRNGDWGYKPVTSDMGPVDTNIQAAKWLKPRLEEWVEKNPDLAKDVPDYEWGWIEKCLGKETANKDRKNLVSSLVKGDKIKLIDTVADGAVVTFIDMITPTKMRILHNGREMSCKTSFIDRKVEESKDERRDSADYLQEVWDALVSVWDKEKFDMVKGYDDEYECEAITIASKDNEGVRAKIYVDDHEGKHPVGFDVIYRYPGDKGVGDLGYYEFQSTDFDETAPEIFAYFDELKGKIKVESKVDDSENILLFQTAKGSEANDAHDALEKLYLDNMDNTVDVVAIRMEDDGADYYRVYATGKRSAVSKFLELYAQNFGKDAFTDSLDSMWTEPSDFKDLLITESKGDNWVAYYFCEDPQGLEWAVLPHAINGIGNASCVNSRGGNDSIAIEYVLDECTPIEDVKGSDIYGKVKDFEDRDIVALTRDEAERIALADDRLEMLKAVVASKEESCKSEATGVAAIYGDGDVSTHENSADGFYVDDHDPMGFAVLNNDTATMKELFSGKAVAPEKPWTYAGWHEDTDAPENKDGSYPYVYDWEREYDLNFVNDWKRVVGDKNNEEALELLLKYAPDFIPSAMDFWNAFHAGYSKGLLRKLFDNIFAVVDKDDPNNNYLGYGDYTYDEVAKFLDGKDEAADRCRIDDYANMRFFDPEEFVKYVRKAYGKDGYYVSIDSVVPVSVLNKANRMAQKNGYKKMEAKKAISCNALVAALQEKGFDVKEDLNGSYRIVAKGDDFDTTDNLLFITTLYPESTSDRDFVSDSAFVRGRVNGNRIVATDLKSVEDIVSVCVDAFGKKTETNKSEAKKSESYQDWIAFYFCKDSQGAEYAVYPQDVHKRNGNTVVGLQSRYGYHTGYRKEYILNSLTPIPLDEVDDSAIYKKLSDGDDREIIAIDKKDAERIMNASNPLSELKKVVQEYDIYKGEGIANVKKSESLTLKQKELKDMARYGEAEDITMISDAEAKELKKKGIETVGVSRGTYGMNGALLRDRDGNKYVITARSSNLFYFV